MRQYNVALRNRGLPPISHPGTTTPATSSSGPSTPSPPASQPGSSHSQVSVSNDLQEAYNYIVAEGNLPDLDAEPNQDLWFPDDTDWHEILAGNPRVNAMADHTSSGEVGSSSNGNVDGARPAKRARADGHSSLPGTAGGQGSGGGGVSGASEHMPILSIPRAPIFHDVHRRVFKKQHKFLTFGIAPKILTKAQAGPPPYNMFFLTSALAEVPVMRSALYLSPEEYTSIIVSGERVTKLIVKVVQRNVRVAFETGSTTTGLATLNQNKNGMFAVGLNKSGYGLSGNYTAFNATETMIPTNVARATYTTLAENLYGVANNDTTFASRVPTHAAGSFHILKNYWNTCTTDKASGGWPTIMNRVNEYDAADAVGQEVVTYEYVPAFAPLKNTVQYRDVGNPKHFDSTVTMLTAFNQNPASKTTVENITSAATPAATAKATDVENTRRKAVAGDFGYNGDIERSQYMTCGTNNRVGFKVQPSLHIGVEAVPSLTSDTIFSATGIDHYTDVQAYYDVYAEMHTEWNIKATRQFGPTWDIDPEDMIWVTNENSVPNPDASCFQGVLTSDNPVF